MPLQARKIQEEKYIRKFCFKNITLYETRKHQTSEEIIKYLYLQFMFLFLHKYYDNI